MKKGSKNLAGKLLPKFRGSLGFTLMLGSRYGYGEYISYGLRGNGLGNSF